MRIAVVGSVYGSLEETYAKLSGKYIHWVLSTGNYGVWPDPVRADRQARTTGVGDFLAYLVGQKRIPIPTLMVGGRHEDHVWIKRLIKHGDGELIENLHYLVNGNTTFLDSPDTSLTVLGLGGTYSPTPNPGNGHYTLKDVQKACTSGPVDIMLTHEGPDGEVFGNHTSGAKGLNKICFATQPRVLFHGKYAETQYYTTKQTQTKAVCVGARAYQIFDITKDSITQVDL
jgi:hypothetical protein